MIFKVEKAQRAARDLIKYCVIYRFSPKVTKNHFLAKSPLYLQKHNPNVPDIPNKLIKPPRRNSLLNQRRFWNRVFDHTGPLECIYTQKKLIDGNFAVEHFVPYAFVSHDLIWNLIPADPSFNSRKNDRLP
jgi:5-methylcytosine-specific restriction endonuclease McrA